MTENNKQILVCVGEMPIRASDGSQLNTVPVYKLVPQNDASAYDTVKLAPNERLVQVGVVESKSEAQERYNTFIAGETPRKSCATPLYIKEIVNSTDPETGLTEDEKLALNPLVTDMLNAFSAAKQEINGNKGIEPISGNGSSADHS